MMKTRAGDIVPAAVISIGKTRGGPCAGFHRYFEPRLDQGRDRSRNESHARLTRERFFGDANSHVGVSSVFFSVIRWPVSSVAWPTASTSRRSLSRQRG